MSLWPEVVATQWGKTKLEQLEIPWGLAVQTALQPHVQYPAVREPEKTVRARDHCALIVVERPSALLITSAFIREVCEDGQKPLALKPVHRPQRRMAGTNGSTRGMWPTSMEEIHAIIVSTPGWRVEPGNGGSHSRVIAPSGEATFIAPHKQSDWRAVKNMILQLRRMGLDCRRQSARAS